MVQHAGPRAGKVAGLREAGAILDRFFDDLLASRRNPAESAVAAPCENPASARRASSSWRQTQIAGIVAFSGALPGAEGLQSDVRSKPPVLLVHGVADNAVPFQSMANAKATLEAAGVPVAAVARPGLGHAIDDAVIALAAEFLLDVLKAPRDGTGVAV